MEFPNRTKHSMLRRCFNWDYCSPCIYSITLTLADRRRPLLGRVINDSPPGTLPEFIRAHTELSDLGRAIYNHWMLLPRYVPEVSTLYIQMMEEHLHGILQVNERLTKPLGNVIAGFKMGCTKIYRQILGTSDSLFSSGFQDTILFRRRQLDRMFKYLQDNPRRLAVKRMFPDLFGKIREIHFGEGCFTGMGNHFLLDVPSFHQIQVSRSVGQEGAVWEAKKSALMKAMAANAVIVSPSLSPGEKVLTRMAFDAGARLIVLKHTGFSQFYKPSGQLFDACANGRLLMLCPLQWDNRPNQTNLSREDACVMNALVQRICGGDAIEYKGWVPNDLSDLVDKSIGK